MHALHSPREAYQRVEFDARVTGAKPAELVLVCYEQFRAALARAQSAAASGDNLTKSQSLTRALAALTALQLGIDQRQPLAPALDQFYASARRTVLDCVLKFDSEALAKVGRDMTDIAAALGRAASS